MINYENENELRSIIDEINGNENISRKSLSYKQFEIFEDRMSNFVNEHLNSKYSPDTVSEIPQVSSINMARRIIKQEASIYKDMPEREFEEDLSETQEDVLESIYHDGNYNQRLTRANEYFKLQNQNILQVLPVDGVIQLRPLLRHNVDVVPKSEFTEIAEAVLLSNFDRSLYIKSTSQRNNKDFQMNDFINQKIADPEDYRTKQTYVLWTDQLNLIINGKGQIISAVENAIGKLPFVDIASVKDWEFWIRSGQTTTDFTVELNSMLSTLMYLIEMQGFSIPVISGPDEFLPKRLKLGPQHAIRFPIDPNNPVPTKLEFVSPNPDIAATLNTIEALIALFLSSKGLDTSTISGKAELKRFSSGVERLLAMVEKFEANKDDYSLFESVETKIVKLVGLWHNSLKGTDLLLPKYYAEDFNIETLDVSVAFKKPEVMTSESEKLDVIEREINLGLLSKKDAMVKLYNYEDYKAEEKLAEIEEEKAIKFSMQEPPTPEETNEDMPMNQDSMPMSKEGMPMNMKQNGNMNE